MASGMEIDLLGPLSRPDIQLNGHGRPDPVSDEALLRAALEVALTSASGPVVLAVSGGRDSMALMYAVARWAPERLATVATFDHGTGGYATDAASLVVA